MSESQYRDSFMDWVNEEYGQNFTEHELMIQFYMNKIANELAILDGGRYDASYYMAWVWEGLEQYWPDYFDSATELDWETKRSTVRANNPWTCGG